MGILFVLMGHGLGSTMAPMTAAVMGAVGPQRAGLGSAMATARREVGGVLGIALLGTVLFTRLGSVLLPKLAELGCKPGAGQRGLAERVARLRLPRRSSPGSGSRRSRSVGSRPRSGIRT